MTQPTGTLTPTPVAGVGVAAFAGDPDILARVGGDDYQQWQRHAATAGGCLHPIRLKGDIVDIDPAAGEVIRETSTEDMPDKVLYVPCGTRRAAICPPCAETYRGDAYQLVRAGLVGGKTVPDTVAVHPAVFVTFTAPSFGPVHARITGPGGRVTRCRPRRKHPTCPHGRSLSCPRRHKETDACLGRPLCGDCYDYSAAVVWNVHAPELWRRTMIGIRRRIERQAAPTRVKVSYAKVAEFQTRGLIHFHALIRLDGHDPHHPEALSAPPQTITVDDLSDVIRQTVTATSFTTAPHSTKPAGWGNRWGNSLDIRPVALSADGEVTSGQVAGYLAKYATKATEPIGLPAKRITADTITHYAAAPTHTARLIRACWTLGKSREPTLAALRRWAHMAGFRGHFLTKSRRYSITFKVLRAARATWRRRHERPPGHGDCKCEVVRVTLLDYAGTGWLTSGDALLAISAAARAREHRRIAREETAHAA